MIVFIDGYNDYYPWEQNYDQFRDYPYCQWSHLYLDEPSLKAWAGYSGFWLYRKSHFVYLAGEENCVHCGGPFRTSVRSPVAS
ncbi:MAG: hypothetical protein IPL14_12610 [Nitrospira sp.]|nr:hypothetical protein [Nitrospira sp.]